MDEIPHGGGLPFPDLSIKGYRAFKSLEVSKLSRVTLITGKNNTGKSSILEALRLYTNNAATHVIYEILTSREEFIREVDESERPSDPESAFNISALFHGFPRLSEGFGPIVISTNGGTRPMKLSMRVGWFVEEEDEDGNTRLVELENARIEEYEYVSALVAETEERKRTYKLDTFRRYARSSRLPRRRPSDNERMPCILVSPYSGRNTDTLALLWDGSVLTDTNKYVVEALQIIDPGISEVYMVAGEVSSGDRTAIVRARNIPQPVPLRSFGDGVNRLFATAVSLVNARGGVLLIDEFENGLHYSVQLDAWRMIFKLAQSLDVQVFATTHSWDAIESFQAAAAEAPEDGALLRLNRRKDTIIPTLFVEDELAIITRDKIEVR